MPMQHLCRRLNLFGVAGSVSCYLSRSRSFAADLLQVRSDLLAAWARRFKVLRPQLRFSGPSVRLVKELQFALNLQRKCA